MIKFIAIGSFFVVVTGSSSQMAVADRDVPAQGKAESRFVEIPQNNLKELGFDWLLVPQRVEFEGFINYGSPIQSTSTNLLGQTIASIASPDVINQPIWQKIVDETDHGRASNLQKLLKEREQLRQRLIEVEALIKKHAKE
jgi:hypothetical protein